MRHIIGLKVILLCFLVQYRLLYYEHVYCFFVL